MILNSRHISSINRLITVRNEILTIKKAHILVLKTTANYPDSFLFGAQRGGGSEPESAANYSLTAYDKDFLAELNESLDRYIAKIDVNLKTYGVEP